MRLDPIMPSIERGGAALDDLCQRNHGAPDAEISVLHNIATENARNGEGISVVIQPDENALEARVAAAEDTEPRCTILDDIEEFLARFVAYPTAHARVAHVLWIAHTHLMEAWDSTPRIAFLSPEPGSGKSRALEVSELLVPRPVQAVNVTPAYLFRKAGAEEGRPTVLYDEIDTVFGPRARDANEEIRGLLNAGHRRHSTAGRCVVVGNRVKTEELPAYCAVALAGLGDLPDTILTRSVIVTMRRRAPGENIEPYRQREHSAQAVPLWERLVQWASAIEADVSAARPAMPADVVDRDADVWEPLLAVADAAGGDWPQRARQAAAALVAQAKQSTPSLGVRLLADCGKCSATAMQCLPRPSSRRYARSRRRHGAT